MVQRLSHAGLDGVVFSGAGNGQARKIGNRANGTGVNRSLGDRVQKFFVNTAFWT